MVILAVIQMLISWSRCLFQSNHMLNPKHFGLSILTPVYYNFCYFGWYNAKKHLEMRTIILYLLHLRHHSDAPWHSGWPLAFSQIESVLGNSYPSGLSDSANSGRYFRSAGVIKTTLTVLWNEDIYKITSSNKVITDIYCKEMERTDLLTPSFDHHLGCSLEWVIN